MERSHAPFWRLTRTACEKSHADLGRSHAPFSRLRRSGPRKSHAEFFSEEAVARTFFAFDKDSA